MIYEAGITRVQGQSHRYIHRRAPHCWVCCAATSGAVSFRIDGREAVCCAPYIACTSPGVSYELETLDPHEAFSLYVLVAPDAALPDLSQLPQILPGRGCLPLNEHPYRDEILQAFEETVRWTRSLSANARELAQNALARALLLVGCSPHSPSTPLALDPRLQDVCDYVRARLAQPLATDELARVANLSPSRFGHFFRDVFDCSPMQYVERTRLTEAGSLLLQTEWPVKVIAAKVGYHNPFHFSTRFARQMGLSPTAYRLIRRGKARRKKATQSLDVAGNQM